MARADVAAPSGAGAAPLATATQTGTESSKVEAGGPVLTNAAKKPPAAPPLGKASQAPKPRSWPRGATSRPFAEQWQKFFDPQD
jgi:hypothetical protein